MGFIQELIVTQWDVNKEDNVLLMLTAFELIVTQWDVNATGTDSNKNLAAN